MAQRQAAVRFTRQVFQRKVSQAHCNGFSDARCAGQARNHQKTQLNIIGFKHCTGGFVGRAQLSAYLITPYLLSQGISRKRTNILNITEESAPLAVFFGTGQRQAVVTIQRLVANRRALQPIRQMDVDDIKRLLVRHRGVQDVPRRVGQLMAGGLKHIQPHIGGQFQCSDLL